MGQALTNVMSRPWKIIVDASMRPAHNVDGIEGSQNVYICPLSGSEDTPSNTHTHFSEFRESS